MLAFWKRGFGGHMKTTKIFVGLLCGRETDTVHKKKREVIRAKGWILQGNP